MAKKIAAFVLLAGLAAVPAWVRAEEAPSLEALVVEMADSPSEHAAVAQHFRAKAAEARAQARRHESMGRAYGGGKLGTRTQLKGHCSRLVEQFNAAASEYDELAKLHDELAHAAP
ncbi:MAG: hypothetical protein FJ091_05325 [Deltaproteobacteria bacterium]|nr:hypothetical protein [Deltaproteobacteria bacterium]